MAARRSCPRVRDSPGIAAAVVIAAGLMALAASRGWIFGVTPARDSASTTIAVSPTPASAGAAATDYRIDAAFYRERNDSDEPLGPDDRLVPGDDLCFHVQVSAPTYVYIVNEDDQGESYLPFPLPGQSLSNPLSPGQSHRLPGKDQEHQQLSWEVSSRGGREHFLLVASLERLAEFEDVISKLSPPVLNRPPEPERLSAAALSQLRGVGGLAVWSVAPAGTSLLLHQQPKYSTLFVPGEQTVSGTWVRQATFDNPTRARRASPQQQK